MAISNYFRTINPKLHIQKIKLAEETKAHNKRANSIYNKMAAKPSDNEFIIPSV